MRALDARAEERLRRVLREFQRIGFELVVSRRRVLEVRPVRHQQLARDFVDGHIFLQPLADPIVIAEHRLVAALVVIVRPHLQQLAPLQRPDVHELLALEQLLDLRSALPRLLARGENFHLLRRRQRARDVYAHTAQESRIVANPARQHPHLVQLRIHKTIHVIPLLHRRLRVLQPLRHHNHLRAHRESVIACHHKRLPPLPRRNLPLLVYLRRAIIAAQEKTHRSHIAIRPVGIPSTHSQPEFLLRRLQQQLLRQNLNADRLHHIRFVIRRTRLQPAQNASRTLTLLREQLSSRVRRLAHAFRDDHRGLRQREIDATPDHLPRQPEIIPLRVIAKQRQPETILSPRRTVATPAVAAIAHKDRHYIIAKRNRHILPRRLHLHRHLHRLPRKLHLQRSRPVTQRQHRPIHHLRHLRIRESEPRLPRHIAMHPIPLREPAHQRLPVAEKLQIHLRRKHLKPLRSKSRCRRRKHSQKNQHSIFVHGKK